MDKPKTTRGGSGARAERNVEQKQRALKRHYTDEFKLRAIQLACPPPTGIGIRPAARQLGVDPGTIQVWLKKARNVAPRLNEGIALPPTPTKPAQKPQTREEEVNALCDSIELNVLREIKRRTGTRGIVSKMLYRDLLDISKTFVKPVTTESASHPTADRTAAEKLQIAVSIINVIKQKSMMELPAAQTEDIDATDDEDVIEADASDPEFEQPRQIESGRSGDTDAGESGDAE